MHQLAKELESKWIKDEMQYRSQVDEAMRAGTPFSGMAAHADAIRECRKELQEKFQLVTKNKTS